MKIRSGNREFNLELESGQVLCDGKKADLDMVKVRNGLFHVLLKGHSYTAEVLKADHQEKSFVIRVNGTKYTLSLKDKYDELLHSLGLDTLSGGGMKELKAPMPGLVLDVRVVEGAEIKKGDGIVVLEAMKMENVLKAAADAIVKKVLIKKGMTVDKNQLLISFVV